MALYYGKYIYFLKNRSSRLTAHFAPPAAEKDSFRGAGVDVRRESSTHAVLAVLTVAGVIHAVL